MNKLIIVVLVSLFSFSAFSQSKNEVDLIQAAFGIDKQEIVMHYVQPSELQKEAFRKVYEEYETERKELGKTRIDLLNEYAEKYEGMTSEQADSWIKKVMALSIKQDKLIKTYYNKVKKVTDAKVATQFYQIEAYILTTIRYSILENIPFVEKSKK